MVGKAESKDEIKSGDLLYMDETFRWGKVSGYAGFLSPFFVSQEISIPMIQKSSEKMLGCQRV